MTAPRELITTTSLADEIAFRLQTAILDGGYPPGTHLLQDELCQRFGVSRTPVREALRKLQAQHLVVLVPNKGAKVRVPSREELIEVYVLRAELEGFACELACQYVSDETLAKLEDAQTALRSAADQLEAGVLGADDGAALNAQFTRANDLFHSTISEAAQNRRLRQIITDLARFFPRDYVWRAARSTGDFRELNIEEHERIRRALAGGDARTARSEMKKHILHASALLVDYLDEHEFWG